MAIKVNGNTVIDNTLQANVKYLTLFASFPSITMEDTDRVAGVDRLNTITHSGGNMYLGCEGGSIRFAGINGTTVKSIPKINVTGVGWQDILYNSGNISVGSGSTLDVSGGALTLAANQISGASVASATTTTKGAVEKATTAEAQAGTATGKYPDVVGVKAEIVAQTSQSAQWRQEQASGTDGGASAAGWNTRSLNVERHNSIAGASYAPATGRITLPAGTYDIDAFATAYEVQRTQLALYNITAAVYQIIGMSSWTAYINSWPTQLRGRITITATTVFELRHYCQIANPAGLGSFSGSGEVEVYVEVNVKKIVA